MMKQVIECDICMLMMATTNLAVVLKRLNPVSVQVRWKASSPTSPTWNFGGNNNY